MLIVEKYIYDESNGLWYELQGDYYIPCLTAPEAEQTIGIWGQRHLLYIKKHKRALYSKMLMTGKLNSYLAEIDHQAEDMLLQLVDDMAQAEGATEQLKAENQLEWVQRMNNIRGRAEEIVNTELIYGDEIYGKMQNQS